MQQYTPGMPKSGDLPSGDQGIMFNELPASIPHTSDSGRDKHSAWLGGDIAAVTLLYIANV